jgi:hypothetical protein
MAKTPAVPAPPRPPWPVPLWPLNNPEGVLYEYESEPYSFFAPAHDPDRVVLCHLVVTDHTSPEWVFYVAREVPRRFVDEIASMTRDFLSAFLEQAPDSRDPCYLVRLYGMGEWEDPAEARTQIYSWPGEFDPAASLPESGVFLRYRHEAEDLPDP